MPQVRALFLSLLVVCPLASAAAPVTERPVSEVRLGTASWSTGETVRATWNGERFLVTWYSARRGGQAMLLDAAGRPLGGTATGLPVSPYAAFWRDGVWYVIGHGRDAFGWVRVGADGVLLDLQPHRLERPPEVFEGAVWTGEALILIFAAVSRTEPTTAWVYDAGFQRKATHTLARGAFDFSLLTDGPTALVAFRDAGDHKGKMRAVLFGRDGQLLRQDVVTGLPRAYAGGTRGDGTGYFFVSEGHEWSWQASLTSFHLGHDLKAKLSLESFGPAEEPYWFNADDLAWDGSAYTFFYRSFITGLRMARVTPDGRPIEDVDLLPLSGSGWASGLATAGGMGTTLLLYAASDVSSTSQETHVVRLRAGHDAASLAAAPELQLDQGAFEQTVPVAASSDTQALVAWREQVSVTGPPRIYATRVLHGQVRDPQSLLLGTLTNLQPEVQLASDGEGFVAAWTDPEGVIVRHVAADGTVAPRIVIPRHGKQVPATSLELLSNGDGYLVAWVDHYTAHDDVFAVRLRGDGTLIDTAPVNLGRVLGDLQGASDGTGYLLAARGRGMLISSDGKVTARPDFGTDDVEKVWWNGTSYSVLVRPADYSGRRLANVTPAGSVTTGNLLPPPPAAVSWAWGRFDACDASAVRPRAGWWRRGSISSEKSA